MAQDGVIIVVVTIDRSSGSVIAGPDVVSRGFVIPEHEEEILEEARQVVVNKISEMEIDEVTEWAAVKAGIRSALGRFLYERMARRPMIVPVVVEV